jgi:hypothetical protein
MPLAGFEPTIPEFKRAKTFHALEREATVTGIRPFNLSKMPFCLVFKWYRVEITARISDNRGK